MRSFHRLLHVAAWACVSLALMALASATSAFSVVEGCWEHYNQSPGGMVTICTQESCTLACVEDSVQIGNSTYVWCECGGTKDGVDNNQYCHAMVRYVPGGWPPGSIVFASFECIKPCLGEDTCYQMAPSDGSGLKLGDKLCGCT